MLHIVLNPGGTLDRLAYGAVSLFLSAAVGCFLWRSIAALKRYQARRMMLRYRMDRLTVATEIVINLFFTLVFILCFFEVIIREPVREIWADQKTVQLIGRWPWQTESIERVDIRQLVLNKEKSRRGRYNVMTIRTEKKSYIVDPKDVGHDEAIRELYDELSLNARGIARPKNVAAR